MELKTILNALELAHEAYMYGGLNEFDKGRRQYIAFRARILKMDAEKDKRIAELEQWIEEQFS